MWLHIFSCVADKAIREMNRKEKEIIRGYLNAVKYASQLESRVRIMLVGDTGSGGCGLNIQGSSGCVLSLYLGECVFIFGDRLVCLES